MWGGRPRHNNSSGSSCSFSLIGFRLSSSSWFACCLCDTCSVAATTRMIYVPRVRIYMPHGSAVVVLTRVYVGSLRHTRQLRAVALSPEEATSIWCCSLHTAAVVARCERRAGLTRSPCSFKNKATRTDVHISHDTPCSLFVGHPGVGKHTLTRSKQCDTKPTAG